MLTKRLRARVLAAVDARRRAKVAQDEAQGRLRVAARELAAAGVTLRASGALLGLSHCRVEQLLKEP